MNIMLILSIFCMHICDLLEHTTQKCCYSNIYIYQNLLQTYHYFITDKKCLVGMLLQNACTHRTIISDDCFTYVLNVWINYTFLFTVCCFKCCYSIFGLHAILTLLHRVNKLTQCRNIFNVHFQI